MEYGKSGRSSSSWARRSPSDYGVNSIANSLNGSIGGGGSTGFRIHKYTGEIRSLATKLIKDDLADSIDRLDYYYWVRQLFIPLFQFSIWLDEYVPNFLRLERQPEPVNLSNLLTPNANPSLSGSGISAPPLRATLGIGTSFILRELVQTQAPVQ